MQGLLNLYEMTPPAMLYLFVVMFIVYGFILWKLMGWYYGLSFKRAGECMRRHYVAKIGELKAEIAGYIARIDELEE